MGRKVIMTKSQINEIVKRLNEDGAPINVDATPDVAAAGGNASIGMKNAKQRLTMQGLSGKDATLSCDSDAIQENLGKPITKAMLNEFRLKSLKENSQRFTKKSFEEDIKKNKK